LQTFFNAETLHQHGVTLESDTTLSPLDINGTDPQTVAKFHLSCFLLHDITRNTISLSLNALRDLFDVTTISRMTRRFESFLVQLFSLSSSICELSLLLPDELQLIHQLNNADELIHSMHPFPIHYQFALQVQEHPQKLAVILDNQSLTYAELLHYTQLVALHLIDECHVKPGDIIGQCIERSIEMMIGMLAIVLCDASYLPFSPSLPIERLHSLIKLTQPHCLISSNGVRVDTLVSYVNMRSNVETFSHLHISMDNTVVMLFTSSSTGMPKVVPLTHRNFINLIDSLSQIHLNGPNDIIVQLASCSFDVHAYECMGSFILGATLVLLRPHGNLDTHYLCQTIEKSQATVIFFVPTSVSILCEYFNSTVQIDPSKHLATLKCVSTGGKNRCH
jgi:non-ribosomal peptide synthetase component F